MSSEGPSKKTEALLPSLGQIKLSDLPWTADPETGASHATQEILIGGERFKLIGIYEVSRDNGDDFLARHKFVINDLDGHECIVAHITYDMLTSRGVNKVITQIEKVRKSDNLKGMGMQLYEKILQFVPDINKGDGPIKFSEHVVIRETSISHSDPLSNDRWDELFTPVLQKYGYAKIADDKWVKKLIKPTG